MHAAKLLTKVVRNNDVSVNIYLTTEAF